ncbi:MAG: hypothetical protein ABI699_18335 [Caldimonas sp.]
MREPFELVHHNRYRVSCRPEPTPEGTFLARVIVSWIGDDGSALDHRLRPELPPFDSAARAADVGRDAAMRWLDALEAAPAPGPSTRDDITAYFAAHREWRAAAAAFEAAMQGLVDGGEPAPATRLAVDAAALKRLHERWLERAVHLAVVQRR